MHHMPPNVPLQLTLQHPVDEVLHLLRLTANLNFHPPIREVSHPAGHIKPTCNTLSRIAKSHSLHFAFKKDLPRNHLNTLPAASPRAKPPKDAVAIVHEPYHAYRFRMRLPLTALQGILLLLTLFGHPSLLAESLEQTRTHSCRLCAPATTAARPDSPSYRKYAPDRKVDILHLKLDITPDFKKRTIQGNSVLHFKPIATPLSELRLDAVDLDIRGTGSSETGFRHHLTDSEIVFTFNPPIPVGKEATVSVDYHAEPRRGLYFRTKEMGYPADHLWTQGEPVESRHWFPCFDHPVEKFTTELTCHVPTGMVALSNGKRLPDSKDKDGKLQFHWLQDKPHVNYLVTLVAGDLKKVEDRHGDLPLEFWTTPDELPHAPSLFRNTRRMMEFFEKEIGISYPWAKYGQVAVHDYHWGGMENTSLTTLNHRSLFSKETGNLFNGDSLVAHELAHQWFGDFVTCRDWSHIWLNEGFATYYDWLWQGEDHGRAELAHSLHRAAIDITNKTNESRGIVWRKFDQPQEMFDYLAYPKGAWVLHMLRSELGADLYRKCIRTYLERNALGSVTTDTLRSTIEELSGRSFEKFFDQWVYGVGTPHLDVIHTWDERTNVAKVSVKQTQKISEDTHLFDVPLTIRFKMKSETVERTVRIRDKEQDFHFQLPSTPELVRIDPNTAILAKIQFKPTKPMLALQLADTEDNIGQLLALDLLADKPDADAVALIRKALEQSKHYAVRIRAAETLRKAASPEAFAALKSTLPETDARVRNAIVRAIGGFLEPDTASTLRTVVGNEQNPGIVATALRALAPWNSAETRTLLAQNLSRNTFRERIIEGALSTMKAQEDPAHVRHILALLDARKDLPSQTFALALETLAHLQRHEPEKSAVRDRLSRHLTDPRERVRLAAINGLGNLDDPKAIALLETIAERSSTHPETQPAIKAIERLRAGKKTVDELSTLRSEITDLKSTSRELRKELDALKKKTDAK